MRGGPAWSPDGASLALTGYRVAHSTQIVTVALDGSHLVVSRDTSATEDDPDRTPDPTHIVVNSNRSPDGERENVEVNRNGTGVVQVSSAIPSGSYDPAVSPDGRTSRRRSTATVRSRSRSNRSTRWPARVRC